MQSLRVFIVEDEVLLLMQLESYLGEAGHVVVGTAMSSREAITMAEGLGADLALVDIHLADGPSGIAVGRSLAARMTTVFMTANPKRVPEDFCGAIGVIAKPYTKQGLFAALDYLADAILDVPPESNLPRSLILAPSSPRRTNRNSKSQQKNDPHTPHLRQ